MYFSSNMLTGGQSNDMFICDTSVGSTVAVVDCRARIERVSWNQVHSSLIAVGIKTLTSGVDGGGGRPPKGSYLKLLSVR